MNDKIKEFAEKSGIASFLLNGSVVSPWVEDTDIRDYVKEFADLIVKECVSICETSCIPIEMSEWRDMTKKEISAYTALALAKEIRKEFGMNMNENINEWLDSCPNPVISRIVDDSYSLIHMASTSHVYEPNTLVVTTLETLNASIFKKDVNEKNKYY